MAKITDYRIVNIRCMAILIVVIGHSIIIYDPEWGIYSPLYESSFLMIVKHYISMVQMPLFIALSGYCYELSSWWNKESLTVFLKKKFKRLILPFFLVMFLWVVPIRLISEYPGWKNISFLKILFQILLGKDTGHLWYLCCLFQLFIVFSILKQLELFSNSKNKIPVPIIFIFLFLLSLISSKVPTYFFLQYSAKYAFWFYFGLLIQRKRESFNINKYFLMLTSLAIITCIVLFEVSPRILYKIAEYVGTLGFVASCFLIIQDKQNKAVSFLSNYSFGIYLFHSPLLYPIFRYMNWLPPIVMVSINIFLCGAVAIGITHILKKNRIGRIMLGEG